MGLQYHLRLSCERICFHTQWLLSAFSFSWSVRLCASVFFCLSVGWQGQFLTLWLIPKCLLASWKAARERYFFTRWMLHLIYHKHAHIIMYIVTFDVFYWLEPSLKHTQGEEITESHEHKKTEIGGHTRVCPSHLLWKEKTRRSVLVILKHPAHDCKIEGNTDLKL